jgi:hypothetical protein
MTVENESTARSQVLKIGRPRAYEAAAMGALQPHLQAHLEQLRMLTGGHAVAMLGAAAASPGPPTACLRLSNMVAAPPHDSAPQRLFSGPRL